MSRELSKLTTHNLCLQTAKICLFYRANCFFFQHLQPNQTRSREIYFPITLLNNYFFKTIEADF